jgi:glycine/D-amino acid oxidase-like deaminating enzyme
MKPIDCDVLIFGGGIAGLWLLDELHRRGRGVLLLEARGLGAGQTIGSQGILHGGLKYSLGGWIDGSSRSVAEMPARWSASLEGRQPPDLRPATLLSPCCHLWRTDSLVSRAGLAAAQVVIRSAISPVPPAGRPAALRDCPGDVLRVEEPVLDVQSILRAFRDGHVDRIRRIDAESVTFNRTNESCEVAVAPPGGGEKIPLTARTVVFTAGEGNAELRHRAGLAGEIMQRRPLHMVMVRGPLPDLFGHCIDGNKTRATITTARGRDGQAVWVVGGEIAEKGSELSPAGLVEHARRELRHILPGVNFSRTQWATYRINRAEALSPGRRRPEGVSWRREQSIITAWPTKLVLAPRLAVEIADALPPPAATGGTPIVRAWESPEVALPPWETCPTWMT